MATEQLNEVYIGDPVESFSPPIQGEIDQAISKLAKNFPKYPDRGIDVFIDIDKQGNPRDWPFPGYSRVITMVNGRIQVVHINPKEGTPLTVHFRGRENGESWRQEVAQCFGHNPSKLLEIKTRTRLPLKTIPKDCFGIREEGD